MLQGLQGDGFYIGEHVEPPGEHTAVPSGVILPDFPAEKQQLPAQGELLNPVALRHEAQQVGQEHPGEGEQIQLRQLRGVEEGLGRFLDAMSAQNGFNMVLQMHRCLLKIEMGRYFLKLYKIRETM